MSRADLVIRGAKVYDGSGAEPLIADVAVSGGRIQAVGDLGGSGADREIEAGGLALAPGFIDVHTHDDRHLLAHPDMSAKVSQGVTTVVAGNCGISLAPITRAGLPPPPFDLLADRPEFCFGSLAEYFAALDKAPAATNAVCLVGHSVLRYDAMERVDRAASDAEIARMQALMAEAMDDGAIGMSTGLFYPPARNSVPAEIEAIAEALSAGGGIYTTHMRDETDGILDSIQEAASVGRHAGVQVLISHHKCVGRRNHGRSAETLALIEKLQKSQHLSLDQYPYIAGSTVLLPEMIARAERVLVSWSKARPECNGRDLAEVAAELGLGKEETVKALQPAGGIYFMMDEHDVRRIMAFPSTMIGSDGLPADAFPHPRLWGTFPRVLGRYARDQGVLTLADAVHRMTGLPAAEFGLKERGRIAAGSHADLVLFDPATVIDRASFEAPTTPAAGIHAVWVNGEAVWADGKATGARPGRAIRRQETNRAAAA